MGKGKKRVGQREGNEGGAVRDGERERDERRRELVGREKDCLCLGVCRSQL